MLPAVRAGYPVPCSRGSAAFLALGLMIGSFGYRQAGCGGLRMQNLACRNQENDSRKVSARLHSDSSDSREFSRAPPPINMHAYMHTHSHCHMHTYKQTYTPIYPSIHPSMHPSIHKSLHPFFHPCLHSCMRSFNHASKTRRPINLPLG